MAQVPDPTDRAAADQFRPAVSRRAGNRTLDSLIDYFTRHPDATAASGEAGLLVSYIHELRGSR